MRQLTACVILLITTGCAASLTIPADAPIVTATPAARLNARVAIIFDKMGDNVVVQSVTAGDNRVLQTYHIAAASRTALKTAFERVFTSAEVVGAHTRPNATGPKKFVPSRFDLILIPEMLTFHYERTKSLPARAEARIDYQVHIMDSRGRPIASPVFTGMTGRSARRDEDFLWQTNFTLAPNAITHAIEDAADNAVKDLPDDEAMRPWRVRN